MKPNKVYIEASFFSFLIHAVIILYLFGYFYYEKSEKSILSKPVQVNLIAPTNKIEQAPKKVQAQNNIENVNIETPLKIDTPPENKISFESLIQVSDINDLLKEENLLSQQSEQNQVDTYSYMIIQALQSAWRKPINTQDGLVCDLRISLNSNGRVISVNLIKSSGNIRFDNSALKAVQRVETFGFFKDMSFNTYNKHFRNIVITFNPS